VKLFADGAFFSQLMQMQDGYLDGHHGEWLMAPERLAEAARFFWGKGWQIHVHVNGDLGVEVVLDVLERLLEEAPREDHRFTLHHFGASTEKQAERIAKLGALVSANPYYVHALGDLYSRVGLGAERARSMVRLGALARRGVRFSLHSDLTMAPAAPLTLAWVAATRRTASGAVLGPEERISTEAALRAVTIDAAFAVRMEDEIGSLAPGKRADFTVLAEDPLSAPAEHLREIEVVATVFEGRVYPLPR
jgi:predicted amidohydrolase YtcJ